MKFSSVIMKIQRNQVYDGNTFYLSLKLIYFLPPPILQKFSASIEAEFVHLTVFFFEKNNLNESDNYLWRKLNTC